MGNISKQRSVAITVVARVHVTVRATVRFRQRAYSNSALLVLLAVFESGHRSASRPCVFLVSHQSLFKYEARSVSDHL
jgi:hypothetical protein